MTTMKTTSKTLFSRNDTLNPFQYSNRSVADQPIYTYDYLAKEIERRKKESKKLINSKFRLSKMPLNLSSTSTFIKNSVLSAPINKSLNIQKRIKDIQKSVKLNPFSLTKSTKNKYSSKILYETSLLLTDYAKRKLNSIEDNEYSISTFLYDNKDNTRNNLFIKVLNDEKKKLKLKETKKINQLKSYEKKIDKDKENFELKDEKDKKHFREIERKLLDAEKERRKRANELKSVKNITRDTEKSIEKVIMQIENDRIIAKFVNQFLCRDYSRFDNSIIVKYKKQLDIDGRKRIIDIDNSTKQIFNTYSHYLDPSYDIRTENIPDNPEKFLFTLSKYEIDILSLLTERENCINSYRENIEKHKIIIDNLEKTCNQKEIEYNELLKEYNKIMSQYKLLDSDQIVDDTDLYVDYIKEIYDVLFSDGDDEGNDEDLIQNKDKNYLINNINDKLKMCDDKINMQIAMLEDFEKDKYIFGGIINNRKNALRRNMLDEAKVKQDEIHAKKLKKAKIKAQKIIIQSRKSEGPNYLIKKLKEKKIIIMKEQILNENEQFINY